MSRTFSIYSTRARTVTAGLLGLIAWGCLDDRVAEPSKEGNASETVAFVSGQIVDAQGLAVVGAEVVLVPEHYSPFDERESSGLRLTRTNQRGEYRIDSVSPDHYSVEARLVNKPFASIRFGVKPGLKADTTRRDTVKALSSLAVTLPEYIHKPGGWIRLAGTRFAQPITAQNLTTRGLRFDSIPSATYPTLLHDTDYSPSQHDTLARSINVTPGATVRLNPFAGWSHRQNFQIHFDASAIGVGLPLFHFPLLLRLDSVGFDFSSAADQGVDVRFSKSDGSPISFEIERWDAGSKRAEIWLRWDTLSLATNGVTFQMHWGKAGVVSVSQGQSVFDTASGFAATWHLTEESPGKNAPHLYQNSATETNAGDDSISSTGRLGAIGLGHEFLKGDCIAITQPTPGLKPSDTVSVSAWVNAKVTGPYGSDIVSMGNNYGIRILSDGNARVFNFNFPRTDSTDLLFDSRGKNLLDGAWHQVVGQITGSKLELFIDGLSAGSGQFKAGITYAGGPIFFIGKHGQGEAIYDFIGNIDEVIVSTQARSAAWIQFSYLSQKPGATVVLPTP